MKFVKEYDNEEISIDSLFSKYIPFKTKLIKISEH